MDDRPAGSQPPQNQPPPQNYQPQPQNYQPQPQQSYQPTPQQPQPQPHRQGPGMPNMSNMANMGAGNQFLMNPDVKLNSIERMTVMLMRLVAWIALVFLVIGICSNMISFLSAGGLTFQSFLRAIADYLQVFAAGAVGAVVLLGLASVVESLIMMRQNRS